MTVTGPGGTWPNGWSNAGHQASTGIVWAAAVRRAPGSPSKGVDCSTLPWVAKLVDIHLGRLGEPGRTRAPALPSKYVNCLTALAGQC